MRACSAACASVAVTNVVRWRRAATACLMAPALWWGAAAQAQTISVPFNVTFKGSVEIRGYPGSSSCLAAYTVPAGNKFRLTDYAIDSYASTVAQRYQYLCSGPGSCATARTAYLTVPASGTLARSLTTGILFNAGESVYLCNYGTQTVAWTINGFLY